MARVEETRRRPAWARFGRDRRGAVAVWFGLSAVALLFLAGTGLDLARSVNQQAEIQGAADAAALAGAGAYTGATSSAAAVAAATNYMNQFKAANGLPALTFTATPSVGTSNGAVSLYGMTVTASAPISNTLMAMAKGSNATAVTATARNPVYNVTIKLANFSSSAADTDAISYYTVPPDGSPPTLTVPLFSNAANAAPSQASVTVQLTASQKLGFMLTNTTGGNATGANCQTLLIFSFCQGGYGTNAYGGGTGSQHLFYSHMTPPSKVAYPGVAQNCSLQVLTGSAKPASGSCFNGLPAYATVNCAQAAGVTLSFYWNDMGGPTDDKDYNDAVYTVTCSAAGASGPKGLVLTN